jgi:hypothetical protein
MRLVVVGCLCDLQARTSFESSRRPFRINPNKKPRNANSRSSRTSLKPQTRIYTACAVKTPTHVIADAGYRGSTNARYFRPRPFQHRFFIRGVRDGVMLVIARSANLRQPVAHGHDIQPLYALYNHYNGYISALYNIFRSDDVIAMLRMLMKRRGKSNTPRGSTKRIQGSDKRRESHPLLNPIVQVKPEHINIQNMEFRHIRGYLRKGAFCG